LLRIRILQKPPVRSVDGIPVDCYSIGSEYELGNLLGALFLAEGWGEPVPLDSPAPYVPFGDDDLFMTPIVSRERPRNLNKKDARESHPPDIDTLHAAADFQRRRRRRRRR
jgi:hypothetical protein